MSFRYPTQSDFEVIDFMDRFDRVCLVHKRLLEKTGENAPFYPDEIIPYIENFSIVDHAWKNSNYALLKRLYTESWILYAESIAGEKTYYNVDDFLSGEAVRDINKFDI